MQFNNKLTQNQVKDLFTYQPVTGNLIRNTTVGGKLKGSIAGYHDKSGKFLIKINRTLVNVNRVVWLYITGENPQSVLYHKDGNLLNNRWENLLLATTTTDLTLDRLKSILKYEPESGNFIRYVSRYIEEIGGIAGYTHHTGYRYINIDGKPYATHRLAWMYVNGQFPESNIDHINKNKSDNRICNLRLANKSENGRNRNLLKNNTTGFVGVSFKKSVNKYVARCSVNKARVHLGYFDTAVQASIAYENFAKTHHGVFYHKSTERINEHIT